ncbi:MAG: acyl--CoA ligase [Candidatus Dormibacteraeota bacterium]|nr:acyl--CoA ligase [Candidatus Dormibacteraeota bacterium]MBO0703685.1 acyl--CoA ligase [Candidatus Dormibacteraeota bacterium]MBO0759630.1 acyl--CoA ligase [Candidatus Dormibacteraeota bacterium]
MAGTNRLLTLLTDAQVRAFTEAGHWRDQTVYALAREHARREPRRVAVRERLRSTTYGELVDAGDRLAAALDQRGLRPGDRVATWLPSRVETAVVLLACSRGGYVACPSLHRDHTVAEVAELLTQMRAAGLVVQAGYGADADRSDIGEAVAGMEHLRFSLQLEPPAAGGVVPDLPPAGTAPLSEDPNTVVYLAFTSGTTGRPKGVMHSDNTLLSPARALAADWSLDAASCLYSLSPLSHNLGFGALITALAAGAELVVHDLPRGASLADRLRETGVTFAFGVPTHAIDLLAEVRAEGAAHLPKLRGFRISGAPVPPVVAQGLLDVGVVPQSGYGMTEAGSHHYTLPGDDPAMIVGSSGRPCRGYEVRIFAADDPDQELPRGEVGQIGGRGASLMLGYFDDQAATESSFNRAGWFLTGDLGWMDEAGYLRITGRKKDVIIRGGHNIFPVKIENLALRHRDVAKAAAVPVPDGRLGEKVCLVVQARSGKSLDPQEVLSHLDRAGLSRYDMPEYFVQVESLPLLPSGKIPKRRLVEWIDEGRLVPRPVRFTRGSISRTR